MRTALIALSLSLAPALLASPPPSPLPYPDMAVDLLRRYLQIDTTNPPGNELRAALFLHNVLEQEGVRSEIDEFAPGRANLIAVLPGDGSKRPLVLAHHMDVVPADAERWSRPPFSGALEDGMIYGRGAEDMKTEGILQLLALVRAKREGLPLARDLVLLATADEEEDFSGALRAISGEGWRERLRNAEYLITEGGENPVEAGRPRYFGIDTAEKGPLWLKLRTTGTPGHGSQPIAESAPNRLIQALERVRQHRTALTVVPTVAAFLREQAPLAGPREAWYRDIRAALRDPGVAGVLYDDREVSALLRNTISITVVRAGYKTNVIPGTAEAELDVRLLPGASPEAFLAELRGVIDDPGVEIVADKGFRAPNESSTGSELYATIRSVLARRHPGVPVVPRLLSGATECVLYRPLGIQCYGFTPLLTTPEELQTGHGDDERIGVETVRTSADVFYEVVAETARRR